MLCLWRNSKILLALLVIALTIGWVSPVIATTHLDGFGPVIAQTDKGAKVLTGTALDPTDEDGNPLPYTPSPSNSLDGVLSAQQHKILGIENILLAGNSALYQTSEAMPATQKLLFQIASSDSPIPERVLATANELRQSLAGAVGGHYAVTVDTIAPSATSPALATALNQDFKVKIMVVTQTKNEAKGGTVFHQSTKPMVISAFS